MAKPKAALPRRKAIHAAVSAALASMYGATGPALAQEAADEPLELQSIQVTGSRIMRTDVEGALPVTVISREDLDLSGYASAADFIRQLPFNSFGSFRPQSGSSAQGDAELSLRGLGSDRTLILVNGRRLPKSPASGASQNLNVIPLGAVERIEILSDGASAVYGSDAIGGVVNVILRDDFEGMEVMWGAGSPSIPENGGDRREGSVTLGTSSDKTSMMAVASWNTRDIVFARDLPWTPSGGSVFSNNYTEVNNFNWTVLPGACNESTGNRTDTFFELESPSAITGTRCGYDFSRVSADEASSDVSSIFARADHRVSTDWSVFADFWYSETESFGRYAPVPDSNFFYPGLETPGDSPNNPTNPASPLYDPEGAAVLGDNTPVQIWHRFDALGNRDTTVGNRLTDFNGGFSGTFRGMNVELGYRITENRLTEIGRNFLLGTRAWELINSGEYDLVNPTQNSADLLNSIKVTTSRISKYDQRESYGSVAWSMFEMGGGAVQWVVGAEYREEDYDDRYDSLSESGSVGGSAGNSAGLDRHATAIFFETLLPVLDNVEFSLAGRFDDYSDYGSDFSPKVSARWQPVDGLTVRGSYGEGFRAPTLDILSQQDAFSADTVNDPQTCANIGESASCTLQINGLRTANPNLDSENSTQFSFGIGFAPTNWLNGTLDYWSTEIEERITFFDAQELVDRDIGREQRPIPSGLGVERAANGTITRIVQGFGNEGLEETSGIDLALNTRFLEGLTNNLAVSYTLDYSINGGRNEVGEEGKPQFRVTLGNTYQILDFSFAWNMNLIDGTDEVLGEDGSVAFEAAPTWVTHDVQATYHTPWEGSFTLGALNVFEKFPPIGAGDTDVREYDFNLYSGEGRIAYVRYTQRF